MVKLFESPNITELDNNNEYDYQSGDVVSNVYHDYQSDPTDVDYMSNTEYDDIMEVPYDNSSSIYNNSNTNNISFDSDNQDDVTELPYEDEDILNEDRGNDLYIIAKELVNTNDKAELRTNIESLKNIDYNIYKMAMKKLNTGKYSIQAVAKYISDYIVQNESTNPSSIGHYKRSTIGDKKEVCPECGESECICDECNSITESDYKRIARYNEFDNGHVIFHYEEMSDEEAEELARKASIDDPNDVYYVKYDDIMNPSSDTRWYKGQKYSYKDIAYRNGKYQPVNSEELEESITEEEYDDFDDYEDDSEWKWLDSKTVYDSDGFTTEYTLYRNNDTGQYVCIFGDSDIYSPSHTEPDFETDDENEAYDWFESYDGLLDDDEVEY